MKAAIFLSISVALLAGCASGPKVVGKWEGSRDWKAIGTQNEEVSRALAGVILELRPNQTFLLQDGGIPFEGTYVVSANEIRFDVLQIMNRPVGVQPEGTQKTAAFTAEVKDSKIYFRAIDEKDAVVLEPKVPEPAQP
ncbi:MAG: hypothetical protein WCK51_12700 [Armatimonadota bacterium]